MIRLKGFLNNLLAFLLSMAFVVLSILITIQWGCFSSNALKRTLIASNYYENVKVELYHKAEAITLPTGLSLTILDNVFEPYELHRDINAYIDATFGSEASQIDTSAIKAKLEQKLYDYLEQVGIEPDREQQTNIEEYVASILEEYTNSIKMPFLDFLLRMKKDYQIIHILGVVICGSMITMLIYSLIKLNHWLHYTLRYIVYSTLAATIMLAFIPTMVLYTKVYTRIQLFPRYLYDFFIQYITNIIHILINISLIFAVLSMALMISIKGIKSNLLKLYRLSERASD